MTETDTKIERQLPIKRVDAIIRGAIRAADDVASNIITDAEGRDELARLFSDHESYFVRGVEARLTNISPEWQGNARSKVLESILDTRREGAFDWSKADRFVAWVRATYTNAARTHLRSTTSVIKHSARNHVTTFSAIEHASDQSGRSSSGNDSGNNGDSAIDRLPGIHVVYDADHKMSHVAKSWLIDDAFEHLPGRSGPVPRENQWAAVASFWRCTHEPSPMAVASRAVAMVAADRIGGPAAVFRAMSEGRTDSDIDAAMLPFRHWPTSETRRFADEISSLELGRQEQVYNLAVERAVDLAGNRKIASWDEISFGVAAPIARSPRERRRSTTVVRKHGGAKVAASAYLTGELGDVEAEEIFGAWWHLAEADLCEVTRFFAELDTAEATDAFTAGLRRAGDLWVDTLPPFYKTVARSKKTAAEEIIENPTGVPVHMLDALCEYIAEHGDALVPLDHESAGLPLGRWIKERHLKRGEDTVVDSMLELVPGWKWRYTYRQSLTSEPGSTPEWMEEIDETYSEMLDALCRYIDRHESSFVPTGHRTRGLLLGRWVDTRRRRRGTNLNLEKVLDSIAGWEWEAKARTGDPQIDFATQIASLRRFADHVGHASPQRPYIDPEGFALGKWVHMRREQQGKNPALDAILEGLDGWEWKQARSDSSATYLKALKAYAKRTGSATPPVSHVTSSGVKLGTWASDRRRRRGVNQALDAALEAIPGWAWTVTSASPIERHATTIEALTSFSTAHGHLRVPSDLRSPAGVKLGEFITYRRKNKGQFPELDAALEAIPGWLR